MTTGAVVLHDNLSIAITVYLGGDAGSPVVVPSDFSLGAIATRHHYRNSPHLVLVPGDVATIPLGSGSATVDLHDADPGGYYILASTLDAFSPGGRAKSVYDALTGMIDDLYAAMSEDASCRMGKNFIQQQGCDIVAETKMGIALGKGVAVGLAKGAAGVVLSAILWARVVGDQVPDLGSYSHGKRRIALARLRDASDTPPSTGPTSESGGQSQPTEPQSTGQLWLSRGDAATAGYYYAIRGQGFAASGTISLTCRDSVDPDGFRTFSVRADASGGFNSSRDCRSGDGPDHWVTADTGSESNREAWSSQGAPPTSTPPNNSVTHVETAGGITHTWTNYTNAGGTEGPQIAAGQTVSIACRLEGFAVANGNTWWYRIADAPWNSAFYASADAFYNNGATSGPLKGTPYKDDAVPMC